MSLAHRVHSWRGRFSPLPRPRVGALIVALLGMLAFARTGLAAEPQDRTFRSDLDQTTQSYVMLAPPALAPPATALIALHGHGADRWQFIREPRDECRAVRDFASSHSLLLISPDYRATTSWMGPAAEADLVQLIKLLRKEQGIARILLSGASMGGTSTLTFAVLHPDLVDGVAAINGQANHLEYVGFQDAISASFGGTKREIPEEYKRRSAEYWPERLTMPVAIALGGLDEVVPPQSCRRLAGILAALGNQPLLLDRPEMGHSSNYADVTECLTFVFERMNTTHE